MAKRQTKVAAKVAKDNGQTYRVYKLPQDLKQRMQTVRAARKINQAALITACVEGQLAGLVEQLTATGLRQPKQMKPARLPVSEGVLLSLKQASEVTTLPATQLLLLALTRECAVEPKPAAKAKRTRQK